MIDDQPREINPPRNVLVNPTPEWTQIMRRILATTAITFAAGLIATLGATSAQAAAPATSAYAGCPAGAVCIYPENTGWNNNHPSDFYYSYGYHNLSNQFGVHRVFNNQTGGATMRTCTGYNGTGCQGYLLAFSYIDKDLTPINSITLEP